MYVKLNEFLVGIKLRANLSVYEEQFNIEEMFMVGKLVCLNDENGKLILKYFLIVFCFLPFKMGSQKMLVKLPQELFKYIGFEYFQRELQRAGFIWEISLKCEFGIKKKMFRER